MSNSKVRHPVGSRHRSSDGAEWSCVAGLKRDAQEEKGALPVVARDSRDFPNRDRPEDRELNLMGPNRRLMGPKIPLEGVGNCSFCPGPGTYGCFANCRHLGS